MTAAALPPFPSLWECYACGLKALDVQRQDGKTAVACQVCEQVRCLKCSAEHITGSAACLRMAEPMKRG